MTENDERNLGERMERLELQQARMAADVAEIKDALLGTLHGGGGMARQVERNELRLVGLEQWRNKHESEATLLVKEFKDDIDELQRQNSERSAR